MQAFQLTTNELSLWLRFIEHQVGFVLPSSQKNWVRLIINRHLRNQKLSSNDFLQLVMQDKQVYHQFFDDILIPKTQFFRHLPTFQFIKRYVTLLQQQNLHIKIQTSEPFIAWSVGCSIGQEAVSMAMVLIEQLGLQADFKVFASDFHQQALSEAKQGIYPLVSKADIPEHYQRWVKKYKHKKIQVIDEILQHIDYFSANLVARQIEIPVKFNQCRLIVCQNVLIYFRQFEQRDIINYLSQYLTDDGVILLGVGELIQLNNPNLVRLPHTQVNAICKNNYPKWLERLYLD